MDLKKFTACLFIRSRTDKSKGRSGPLACLSFLKRSRPWQLAQETGEKKRPLSRAFLLATDCGELLGDYLHVASMPNSPTITAQIIKKVITVDSPTL